MVYIKFKNVLYKYNKFKCQHTIANMTQTTIINFSNASN